MPVAWSKTPATPLVKSSPLCTDMCLNQDSFQDSYNEQYNLIVLEIVEFFKRLLYDSAAHMAGATQSYYNSSGQWRI